MNKHLKSVGVSLLLSSLLSLQVSAWAVDVPNASVSSPSTPVTSPQAITYQFTEYLERDDLERLKTPKALGKKLEAYTLTIQNNSPHPVQVISGSISNHLSPEEAYFQAKQSAGKQYATAFVCGLALLPFTFGIGFVVEAFIVGPIAAMMAGNHNQKALKYVSQNPGQIPLDTLQPGQSKQYGLITLKGVKPELLLMVQDLETKTEWSVPQ